MAKLQLEYLDLFLIHWMQPNCDWQNAEGNYIKQEPLHKTWEAMEQLVEQGLVRSIGVSNCPVVTLMEIFTYAKVKPAVNQIELHPLLVQKEAVDFQRNKLGVQVTAYAPLGAAGFDRRDPSYAEVSVLKEPVITELAAKHGKSVGQVLLNWHVKHRGHIVIPKTSKLERLAENINFLDFQLTEDEYHSIDALDQGIRFYDPKFWKTATGLWQNIPYFDQNSTRIAKM